MQLVLTQTEKTGIDSILYANSKSPQFSKIMRITKVLLGIILLAFAVLSFFFSKLVSLLFLIAAGITFLIYPRFQRWFCLLLFTKMVRSEEYKNQFGQQYTIDFMDNYLEVTGSTANTKYNYDNFAYFSETTEYIFLKLTVGNYLLFPKDQIPDLSEFIGFLKNFCSDHSLQYIDDRQWKW